MRSKNIDDLKIRQNFTLDREAINLLDKFSGRNKSAYISELIIDRLGTHDRLKKRYIAELSELQEKFKSINFNLQIEFSEENEVNVTIKKKKPKNLVENPKEEFNIK